MKSNGEGLEARSAIDWEEVYAQLERRRQAVDAGGLPPEELKRILRERAKALAQVREEAKTPTEVLELLVFALANDRYGVEPTHVLDVAPVRRLTSLPGAPGFVLGVMNHMGRIHPVLDLRRLLDPGAEWRTEGKYVVVVETGEMTFGIACDAVTGMIRIGAHEVAPAPATFAAGRRGFIRGVTADIVTVLDLEALARDPRIVVNDEIG